MSKEDVVKLNDKIVSLNKLLDTEDLTMSEGLYIEAKIKALKYALTVINS